jgi:two-component system chemotaxis response regulator CheY
VDLKDVRIRRSGPIAAVGVVCSKPAKRAVEAEHCPAEARSISRTAEVRVPRENACLTVLIVDDDPSVLEVLELALSDEGYEVVVARDGREALERALANRPDLMLVDLMMPVMDGWQFVRECRKHDECGNTPVIILSAARNVDETVRELGVQAVIPKPFNVDHLLDLVAAHAA